MTVPRWSVPLLIILFALLTLPLKQAFTLPSAHLQVAPGELSETAGKRLELLVDGVKCRGTAEYFLARFRTVGGVLDITAYAADHRVILRYDPAVLSEERIRQIAEAPVQGNDGQRFSVFQVKSMRDLPSSAPAGSTRE